MLILRLGGACVSGSYSLGAHFEGLVQALVESGRYSSASEVVRDGLRLLEEREATRTARLEALRRDLDAALESGPTEPWSVEDIKAEGRRRKAAHRAT